MSALAIASVLTVVGSGSVADAAAPLVSVQRHAGATRYDTAAAVAQRYVSFRQSQNPPVQVDTVVLTSGEEAHFGYALAAPPLARQLDAPLLITAPSELSGAAARFLRNNSIDRVVIIGGPDVVSSSVEEQLRADGYDADRISGGDAYATAVSVAEEVGRTGGSPGVYGRRGRTVLLATGENFADALALGPLAYEGRHPVLLTPRGELHADVAGFLRSAGVSHVIVAGGTAAVSRGVQDAVERLRISVQRLAGNDRFETAAVIARELLDSGNASSCFDGSSVGLAYGYRSPDAIVSGPLLGVRCAPLLLTDIDRLDAETRRFLSHVDYLGGGDDGRLRMMVFGGAAAVSADTAAEAQAAATLETVRARLSGLEGRCSFEVTFDEPVLTSQAKNVLAYRVGGSTPADATVQAGTEEVTRRAVVLLRGSRTGGGSVPTGCVDPLEAGTDIAVAGGIIRAADGKRVVARASARVADDNRAPRLTITAFVGGTKVWVDTDEPVLLRSLGLQLRRDLAGTANDLDQEVALRHSGIDAGLEADVPTVFGRLRLEDTITVRAGAVRDLADNPNAVQTVRPGTDTSAPRIARVLVTLPTPVDAARVTIDADDRGSIIRDAVEITSKANGDAAGARGNKWTMKVEIRSGWAADQVSVVSVSPSSSNPTMVLRASDKRTLRLVVADLNQDSSFASRFNAEVASAVRGDTATLRGDSGPDRFADGTSINRMRVEWNEAVIGCGETGGVSLGNLAVDRDRDDRADFRLDGTVFDRNVEFVNVPDQSNINTLGAAACDTSPGARVGTLVAWLRSADYDALPSTRSQLIVGAGAAQDRAGNRAAAQTFRGFTSG
ncbi:cell wall-binding repeat-containing protein [Candidatus Poriferisodalis sp.]|uniref:cell wall-binding repeat-containing protein n=1 Tax=Candidatus Poriferisodalis sp. TaxID=3101277 RepID=UPI003B01554E